jgi:predicted alpha/beta superfamily hydrolase
MRNRFSLALTVVSGIVLALGAACTSSTNESIVTDGTLRVHESFSSDHVIPRTVSVWLPPGYDSTRAQGYPVLYMHDGQNLFRADSANFGVEWQVDETLADLIAAGSVPPTIVVGLHSTDRRTREYLPETPFRLQPESVQRALRSQVAPAADSVELFSDAYLRFLVEEVKPFVDRRYNTDPATASTYVAGSSMGGLISLYALAEYPEVFAGAAGLSTHWTLARTRTDTAFAVAFREYLDERLDALRSKRLYFDHGTRALDSLYAPHQALIDSFLAARNFPDDQWTSRVFEGAEHHERAWAARFDSVATFLLPAP